MQRRETVLVTGGTGFIGSHVVERLVSLGHEVRCLVRRTSSLRWPPPAAARLVQGDFVTGAGLDEACDGVDTVYHLAGVTKATRTSDYYAGNADATAALVRACAGVPRLVHVSSLAAAGPSPDGVPVTEDAPPNPVSHYGRSKLAAERVVRESPLAARATIVRPPVVFGPRDTDVLHFFRAANRGLMLSVGRAERLFSLIYVGDLVEGLLAAARCPGAAGRTYYLADPQPLSWTAFGAAAADACGRKARTIAVPRGAAWAVGLCAEWWSRLSGSAGIISREKIAEACFPNWTCDAGRAAQELQFLPRTPLPQAIAQTVAWYRSNGWLT